MCVTTMNLVTDFHLFPQSLTQSKINKDLHNPDTEVNLIVHFNTSQR